MITDFIDNFNSLPVDLKARVLWIAGIVVLVWSFRRYLMKRSVSSSSKKR